VAWLALMALAAASIPLLQDDAHVWAAAAAAPVAVVALVGRYVPRIAATLVAGLLPLVAFSTAGDLGPISWWSTVAIAGAGRVVVLLLGRLPASVTRLGWWALGPWLVWVAIATVVLPFAAGGSQLPGSGVTVSVEEALSVAVTMGALALAISRR